MQLRTEPEAASGQSGARVASGNTLPDEGSFLRGAGSRQRAITVLYPQVQEANRERGNEEQLGRSPFLDER